MNINDVFPGKYLKASDLKNQDATVTISGVVLEDVGSEGKKEEKAVVYFQGKDRGLVLNKTNSGVISDLYGDETDNWVGKMITMFPTQTDFAGKSVECIRIRINAPQPPTDDIPI